ncbi:MAG: DNA polymerase IV [Bacteroidales bacterium]|nr:DNA polymerase IV [Bacteroidales bacterium]
MDAFYASVEQRDNPSLIGKPLVVAHDAPRSVVATASYAARAYGIHSAMSLQRAKSLCPSLVIAEPRFETYKQVSQQIHEIFHRYTDIIEPVSLDEAFLDVTSNKQQIALAVEVAKRIKHDILCELFLTASAGVSYNKFLAKIASDWNKPDGLKVIHPSQALAFIDNLKVEKIWGVGPRTLQTMHSLGIYNGKQLRKTSLQELVRHFGKAGKTFYDYARGKDLSPVCTYRERKSVSCEQTFAEDLSDWVSVTVALYNVVLDLVQRLDKSGFKGRRLTLKVKYFDFTVQTLSLTDTKVLDGKDKILPLAKQLMKKIPYTQKAVRLIGLGVSSEAKKKDTEPTLF